MAESCSNWKRWRMELLVSSMMPTRSGRLVCWVKREHGFRRTPIVEQAEVLALEPGDEAALLVGDGEDEIDFVDLDLDGRDRLVLSTGGWLCARCGSGCRREARSELPVAGVVRGGGRCRSCGWAQPRVCAYKGAAAERNREQQSRGQKPGRTIGSVKCGH